MGDIEEIEMSLDNINICMPINDIKMFYLKVIAKTQLLILKELRESRK